MDLTRLIRSQVVLSAAFFPPPPAPSPQAENRRKLTGASPSLVDLAAKVVAVNFELYQDCWVPKPLHVHIQKFMEPKAQRQMLDAVKKYHPNGNVKSHKEFDDEGQLHGKMEEWYANGHKCREECYEHGVLNGEARWWHESGGLWTQQHFLNGHRHGECVWYYPSGKPHRIVNYKNGLKDGHYETYYPNGLKCEEGQYQDDQEVGQWRKWSRMGHFLGCSEPSTIDHPLPAD